MGGAQKLASVTSCVALLRNQRLDLRSRSGRLVGHVLATFARRRHLPAHFGAAGLRRRFTDIINGVKLKVPIDTGKLTKRSAASCQSAFGT